MNPGIYGLADAPVGLPRPLLGLPAALPMIDARPASAPAALPNLVAWYDATVRESLVFNGSTVSTWSDLSGRGFHLTQTTAANQPTYVRNAVNGLPSLRWPNNAWNTGAMTRMTNASLSLSRPTVFAAFRIGNYTQSTQIGRGPVVFDSLNNIQCVMYAAELSSTTLRFTRGGGVFSDYVRPAGVFQKTFVATGVARTDFTQIFVNGISANIVGGSSVLSGISVGQIRGNPTPVVTAGFYTYDGDICEIIVHDGPVADSQRMAVERYLMTKWGATSE